MRIFPLLFLLIIVCKGDHWKYRQLIDLLRRVEETADKRHEVTSGKRHEVTAGKRHEVTAGERREVTADKRHEVTADKRHEVTADKRRKVTAGKRHEYTTPKRHEFRQWTTESFQPKEYMVPPTSMPNPAENKLSGLEEAFLFPGSHYLIDTIQKHCESGMGLNMPIEDIRDQFQFPVCETKVLQRMMLVLKQVEDPQGVALLVTRSLIKPLLMERMKCPAAILDMGIFQTLLRQKNKFMGKDDYSMFTFFYDMIPRIDPRLEPFTEDIASNVVQDLHGSIFGETMEFLWKYGLKDLAIASHKIFHHLHHFFDDVVRDMAYSERESEMMQHLQSASSDIKCPSSAEVIQYHQKEVIRFKSVFGIIHTLHVCVKVADSLNKFINMTLPGYEYNFQNDENSELLSPVCEGIKVIIDDIVKRYSDYEDFLFSMQIKDLQLVLDKVLTDEEWKLVEEALKRLNFIERR